MPPSSAGPSWDLELELEGWGNCHLGPEGLFEKNLTQLNWVCFLCFSGHWSLGSATEASWRGGHEV